MKQHLKQLEQEARQVKLEDQEKALMKQRLDTYREEHPVRNIRVERQRMQSFIRQHPMPIAALALALLLGGGTSAAAAQSLPGDTLYPIKTEINEEVRNWFTFSDEKKAAYQAELAERRNEEIEKLRKKGRLTAERAKKARAKFEDHAQKADRIVDHLEEHGNSEAAALVETRLEAVRAIHEEIRERIEESIPEDLEDTDREAYREAKKEIMEDYRDELEENRDELHSEINALREVGELPERSDIDPEDRPHERPMPEEIRERLENGELDEVTLEQIKRQLHLRAKHKEDQPIHSVSDDGHEEEVQTTDNE